MDTVATCHHMKYPQEGRLCLVGVAPVLLMDGKEEGQQCEPFNYTGKIITTIDVYTKLKEGKIWQTLGAKCLAPQQPVGRSKIHWIC